MSGMFIVGALGSWGASLVRRLGGWEMASLLGGALSLAGLLIHLVGQSRRR